ncbi:hypothetical protein B0T16DRAFT_36189 [Cercophora newfieldiana]|uniref:Uncharacterized protein n=1 Tax=Cercophora newfieldiana TaxID=92897 RepID=A0AA40CYL5_9PEZI|nr:hypothetical protein B0T16DRAFT_36189 [Cercophora newfieldiana]
MLSISEYLLHSVLIYISTYNTRPYTQVTTEGKKHLDDNGDQAFPEKQLDAAPAATQSFFEFLAQYLKPSTVQHASPKSVSAITEFRACLSGSASAASNAIVISKHGVPAALHPPFTLPDIRSQFRPSIMDTVPNPYLRLDTVAKILQDIEILTGHLSVLIYIYLLTKPDPEVDRLATETKKHRLLNPQHTSGNHPEYLL